MRASTASLLLGLVFAPALALAHEGPGGPEHRDGMSASQVSQQLSNPVSNIWSLQYSNNFTLGRGFPSTGTTRGSYAGLLQPVMPLHLTEDWNLIVRPVGASRTWPSNARSGRAPTGGTTCEPETRAGAEVSGAAPCALLPPPAPPRRTASRSRPARPLESPA